MWLLSETGGQDERTCDKPNEAAGRLITGKLGPRVVWPGRGRRGSRPDGLVSEHGDGIVWEEWVVRAEA